MVPMVSEVAERLNIKDVKDLVTHKNESRPLRYVVTGGCGYFGFCLADTLYQLGAEVIVADIRLPPQIQECLSDKLKFLKMDLRNYEEVKKAFTSVDCVFHVGSFGMTGIDQLNKKLTEEINVQGTENVIRVCIECNVPRLVYTSSYNVVFTNKPIINGSDFIKYADPNQMVEYYSRTKQKADQKILAANMTELPSGGFLRTCCIRPPGICGPTEHRHFDRVAKCCLMGAMCADIFNDAVVDWVHSDNLVQAHLLAALSLSPSRDFISAGQAYFINDGKPMTMLSFIQPMKNGLGVGPYICKIPAWIVYYCAFILELIHCLLAPIYTFHPLLTRHEVLKMTVSHHQCIDRARRHIGYNPVDHDIEKTIGFYLKENYPEYLSANPGKKKTQSGRLLSFKSLRLTWNMTLFIFLLCVLMCTAVPLVIV